MTVSAHQLLASPLFFSLSITGHRGAEEGGSGPAQLNCPSFCYFLISSLNPPFSPLSVIAHDVQYSFPMCNFWYQTRQEIPRIIITIMLLIDFKGERKWWLEWPFFLSAAWATLLAPSLHQPDSSVNSYLFVCHTMSTMSFFNIYTRQRHIQWIHVHRKYKPYANILNHHSAKGFKLLFFLILCIY